MRRASSLPIAEFCGAAARLSDQFNIAGRSPVMSTAAHALWLQPGTPACKGALSALTPDERAEIYEWSKPEPVELERGEVLYLEDALRETRLGIDVNLQPVDPASPDALVAGSPDAVWVVEGTSKVCYIGDLKRSRMTANVTSLQLAAYGFMACAHHDADAFVPGIFYLEEGEWDWGEPVMLGTLEADLLWERLRSAAQRDTGAYHVGPHCTAVPCYQRARCPAFMVDPSHENTALAKYEVGALSQDRAAEYLLMKERVLQSIDAIDKAVRLLADEAGGIVGTDGRVWKGVRMKGRETLDKDKLESELGQGYLADFMKRGKDYVSYKWTGKKKK